MFFEIYIFLYSFAENILNKIGETGESFFNNDKVQHSLNQV